MIMWLIFSDIHLDQYKAFATLTESGLNSRLATQISVFRDVKRVAKKNSVSRIFFLGDLFNSLTPTISKIVYNVGFYMCKLLADNAALYLVVGNHDIYEGIHLFTPFESIPNTKVIFTTETIKADGKLIDIVPWNSDFPSNSKSDYCFGHFGITGAVGNSGVIPVDTGVTNDMLSGYKIVLAGHYHVRQMLGNGIFHVGSVMANSFQDSVEDKGVWLLDPSKDHLSFVPIKSPKFITLEVNDNNTDVLEKITPDNFFRLIVTADNIQLPQLPNNVIVEYEYKPSSTVQTSVAIDEPLSYIPIISEFIDNSNTALDKSVLKQKALELLDISAG